MHLKRLGSYGMAFALSAVCLIAGSDSPLADAAEERDTSTLRTLLEQGVDVNLFEDALSLAGIKLHLRFKFFSRN